ncbi:M10 family metallopeptidase C-terminal domain-containing protein [Pseudomonas defluvii]|uniref:M10 family metallopeptidase C-terminal domain-containing protein n=1 Tax=Pseudomonas defluvii TaxID=1876757 RepID=UPI003905AF1D
MPSPLGYSSVWYASLSNNVQLNSLLFGTAWGNGASTTNLTYSFINPYVSLFARRYTDDNEYKASYALTGAQQTAVTSALNNWSAVANIKFTQVKETASNVGDLRFGGYADMSDDAAAWAYFPDRTPSAGDVWIGPATNIKAPVKGTYDYMTFVHEIGHALGLKHPFSTSTYNYTVLAPELDDVHYTVMSYNNAYSFEPTSPMLLDILAIQQLYGANTKWQTGNNTYQWGADQSVFETLWDAGGIDTLDASNQNASVLLNLNEGQFSNIGKAFYDQISMTDINNGLSIAYGAKIENATGSAFDDTLIGNALNNVLDGRGGSDTMIGGAGNDTYIVDNIGDIVSETSTLSSEIDTVLSSVSYALSANLEVLTLTGKANANGTGNALNNRITGNAGANVLDGGAGIDTLIGGTGNDTYVVDNSADIIIETSALASEIDTVRASVSWTLGANLENLTLTGSDNLNGTGNTRNNVLIGNAGDNLLSGGAGIDDLQGGAGNDLLDGGVGADTLSGGLGDDIYVVDNIGDKVIEAIDEGRDLVRSSISYTLADNIEDGLLLGSGALKLAGNALNNTLTGNSGANVLDGAGGADVLDGGAGNDTYYVNNLADTIIERGTSLTEIDNVFSTVSWTLGANLENLTLTGLAAINGTGNALNNRITGNAGANILDGGAGIDTLIGGAGNDTYVVDNLRDVIIEQGTSTSEIDTVRASVNWTLGANLENLVLTGSSNLSGTGNTRNNVLIGNAGDNLLNGGAGADTLSGGLGNDIYVVDNIGDIVTEASGEGHDLVRSSISYTLADNVEDGLLLGSSALKLVGNLLDNTLTGNAGANILDGAGGTDTLDGGAGNDTYYVDSTDDVIIERGTSLKEIDSVFSSVNWTLGANLENLTLTGSANLEGTGNALNNRITGNAGDNLLDGGAGIDTLIGGTGNDTYVVDNLRDTLIETSTLASEIDSVRASVNWTLGKNLENLTLTGSANLNGTGNELDNVLIGNSANNTLNGGAGNDQLNGGAGNDLLIGGLGTDTLTGGSGADRFVFNLLNELGKGNARDVITDFNSAEGDKIDLSKLDANVLAKGINTFSFIGADAFSAAGQVRFVDHILYGNVNATPDADFEIHLVGVNSFSAQDMIG